MNTSKLKTFAQTSRRMLMEGVSRRITWLGFDANGKITDEPLEVPGGVIIRGEVIDDPTIPIKWNSLKSAIRNNGIESVIEEGAYTWFNRLLAIQILSKNGYDLPQLEYESDKVNIPVILSRARRGSYNFLKREEQKRLQLFVNDFSNEQKAFAILLTGYCHSNTLLNRVFGRLDDFTELLLPDNILSPDGFIHLLNTTDAINNEDYRQVELIGWLYQFYISEKKDQVFAAFKQNKKAEAKDIPAATQIFTPNWIVKYMVQNTVGRIWLDEHPGSPLRQKMKYLVEPPQDSPTLEEGREVSEKTGNSAGFSALNIKEITQLKLLDPACGSGHILVEGFYHLYDMYMEDYYLPAEAVENILQYNLYGLDIDLRAAQLAQFAVLLAAASRHPGILKSETQPHIFSMPEPAAFSSQDILDFLGLEGLQHEKVLSEALTLMQQAKNLGSVMVFMVSSEDRQFFIDCLAKLENESRKNFVAQSLYNKILPFMEVIFVLTNQYEVISANPPYMVSGNMNDGLKEFIEEHFPLTKGDLNTVFMEVSFNKISLNGKFSMINQTSWMFKPTYKDFRRYISSYFLIDSLIHLGPRVFDELSGEVVQSTVFVVKKSNLVADKTGNYYRVIEPSSSKEKEKDFLNKINDPYKFNLKNLEEIPEMIFAYWISKKGIELFRTLPRLNEIGEIKKGIASGDDNLFFKFWFEISFTKIDFTSIPYTCSIIYKWLPINKGGGFRKWSGNFESVVNWYKDGLEIKNYRDSKGKLKSRPQNLNYSFLPGITYNIISSKGFVARMTHTPSMMSDVGPTIFKLPDPFYCLGVLSSSVGKYFLDALCPTYKYDTGAVGMFPILIKEQLKVREIVKRNIQISKSDWDSLETSWDFNQSPLITRNHDLETIYNIWKSNSIIDFFVLHSNEEELNRIHIESYGLAKN